MCRFHVAKRTPAYGNSATFVFVSILTFLIAQPVAKAGLVLSSGSGTVTYSVRPLSPAPTIDPSTPIFRAGDGSLIYPGNNGFPRLGSESGPVQTASAASTSRTFASQANASQIGSSGQFGDAFTEIISTTRGSGQGANAQRAGNYYNATTFIQSSGVSNVASVSVSRLTSTFVNTVGSGPITVTPGLVLNVTGTLGDLSGSFVEGSLTGSITYQTDGGIQEFVFDPVIIAYNGHDAVNTSGSSTGFLFTGTTFSASGTSLFETPIVIGDGASFTIKSTLTLASDPNSIIRISTTIPPLFPNIVLPDIGAFAGGDTGVPGAVVGVPEPATAVQALSAMTALALFIRKRRGLDRA